MPLAVAVAPALPFAVTLVVPGIVVLILIVLLLSGSSDRLMSSENWPTGRRGCAALVVAGLFGIGLLGCGGGNSSSVTGGNEVKTEIEGRMENAEQGLDEAKEQAAQKVEEAKESASHDIEEAKEAGTKAELEEAKESAKESLESAKEEAADLIEEAKERSE